MSKSTLNVTKNSLHTSYRELDDVDNLLDESPKLQLKSRNHLLADLPADLHEYFLKVFVVDKKKSGLEVAKDLRLYARISCAHRDEVVALLRDDAYREVAFCSTRSAIPMFINKQSETLIPKKINAKTRLHQLIKDTPRLHANFCFSVQTEEGQKKIRTNRTPKRIMGQLLDAPALDELRIDVSGPARNKRHKAFDNGRLNDLEHRFVLIEKHARFIGKLAKKMAGLAESGSSIKKVELTYQNWPDGLLVNKLLSALANHAKSGFLKVLDLSYGFGYEEVALGIRSITKYDLGKEFIHPLCDFLRANTSLDVLVLRDARLGKFSVNQLASALEVNKSLRSLDISDNPMHQEGLSAIACALEVNQGLEELNLEGAAVNDDGADSLLAALKKNTKLKFLLLRDNMISEKHPIWKDPRVKGDF